MITLTDGKKIVEITMRKFDGNVWSPDFARDFFDLGSDEICTVADVDYCVDQAKATEATDGNTVEVNEVKRYTVEEVQKDIQAYCFGIGSSVILPELTGDNDIAVSGQYHYCDCYLKELCNANDEWTEEMESDIDNYVRECAEEVVAILNKEQA